MKAAVIFPTEGHAQGSLNFLKSFGYEVEKREATDLEEEAMGGETVFVVSEYQEDKDEVGALL